MKPGGSQAEVTDVSDGAADRLAEIEQRLGAITTGWYVREYGDDKERQVVDTGDLDVVVCTTSRRTVSPANAEFIAHAPEDIAYLLSALAAAVDEALAEAAEEVRRKIRAEATACETAGIRMGSSLLYRDEVVHLVRQMAVRTADIVAALRSERREGGSRG